ncbi:hypothetical protein HK098_007143 [Nowakowskiella sp. JEL0407]|nr:hypothetical protein HK098_007143 [Nowakowskiella sp. JEL0407]
MANNVTIVPQSIPDNVTEIGIYVFDAVTIIFALFNLSLAVINYNTGSPLQKNFNISIIFTALTFVFPPVIDIIGNYALYDKNPLHTQQYFNDFEPNPEDEGWDWKIRVATLRVLQLAFLVTSTNLHVLMFYFNFTNIRLIQPFSMYWDYAIIVFYVIVTIAMFLMNTVFLRYLQFRAVIFAWSIMFFDTVLFHFLAIFFLVKLRNYIRNKEKKWTLLMPMSTTEGGIERVRQVSRAVSTTSSQKRTSASIYKTLIISGAVLFTSNMLLVAVNVVPVVYSNQWNLSNFLFRTSNLLACVLLLFTLGFVKTVRRLMASIIRHRPSTTTDMSITHLETPKSPEIDLELDPKYHTQDTQTHTHVTTEATVSTAINIESITQFTPPDYSELTRNKSLERNSSRGSINTASPSPSIAKRNSSDLFLNMPLTNVNEVLQRHGNISNVSGGSSPLRPRVCRVMQSYINSNREDEMPLYVGDRIRIELEFADGWALGISESTGNRGYFPMMNCELESTGSSENNRTISPIMTSPQHQRRPSNSVSYISPTLDKNLIPILVQEEANAEVTRGTMLLEGTNVNLLVQNALENFEPAGPTTPSKSILMVVSPYTPTRDDELELRIGDRVVLETAFDDSWGFGSVARSEEKKQFGFLPLTSCVVLTSISEKKKGKKAS